jgi:hypothetical protein
MPDYITHPRHLGESEFTAIRDRLLASAPEGLSESDFHLWVAPRLAFELGKAETSAPTPEGSPIGRFLSNAGSVLNPAALVTGLYNAVRHPQDTAMAIGAQQAEQGMQAVREFRGGNPSAGAGRTLAAAVPILGPVAAEAGEQIAEGDVAGGFGKGAGLLVPMGAPSAIRATAGAVRRVAPAGLKATAAGALEEGAAARIADVMTPKVGPNKTRFANTAVKVAPDLVGEPAVAGGWSRDALHGKVGAKLEEAAAGLDEAANARMSARTFPTKPLIDGLLERRRALTAEAVEGSKAIPRYAEQPGAGGKPTPAGPVRDIQSGKMKPTLPRIERPIGQDVVPAPNAARVAEIDRAIAELKELGPFTRYESIRRIREAYDGPAKAIYNPSMTADFLKAQGGKMGAADVTGVLRENLAKWDPQTAKANASYSVFKSANDVLEAAAEAERARPTMFRRTMTRVAGASAGGGIGLLIAEVSEQVASAGWTTKLKTAQAMGSLAKAIQRGDSGHVASLANQIKRIGAQAVTLAGNATSPSGSQTQTTVPAR